MDILSNHHKVEIAAIDVITQNIYVFGCAENYTQRIYVIYDGELWNFYLFYDHFLINDVYIYIYGLGIHYDPVVSVRSESAAESLDITIFRYLFHCFDNCSSLVTLYVSRQYYCERKKKKCFLMYIVILSLDLMMTTL